MKKAQPPRRRPGLGVVVGQLKVVVDAHRLLICADGGGSIGFWLFYMLVILAMVAPSPASAALCGAVYGLVRQAA